jgi:hypothetical protein
VIGFRPGFQGFGLLFIPHPRNECSLSFSFSIMRRLFSVFRHKDPENNPPSSIASTPLLTVSHSHPSNASSASSSASGSASVRTPDDDPNTRFNTTKKTWLPSWLARAKSGTLRRAAEFDDRPPLPDFSLPPPHDNRTPMPHDTDEDTSEDSDDEADDDDDSPAPYSSLASTPISTTPAAFEKARQYLRTIISNSLVLPSSSPPLFHVPGTHLFPRSANNPRLLPYQDSLRTRMLKSHLLRTLQRPSGLSSSDTLLVSVFSTRSAPPRTGRTAPLVDEHAVDPSRLSAASYGLRRWISRPCFEDRFSVWLLSKDSAELSTHVVTSPGFAVAELEFSIVLEALAGLYAPQSDSDNGYIPTELLDPPAPAEEDSESSSSSSSLLSGEYLLFLLSYSKC